MITNESEVTLRSRLFNEANGFAVWSGLTAKQSLLTGRVVLALSVKQSWGVPVNPSSAEARCSRYFLRPLLGR